MVSCGHVVVMMKMSGLSWARHCLVHVVQMHKYCGRGVVLYACHNVCYQSSNDVIDGGLVHMERRWRHIYAPCS